ncbi:MAG: hypothetical protein HXY41_05560 [Chloroflexi bacterium]|nr:hypothetical protein [Chloroflexota bacterium]
MMIQLLPKPSLQEFIETCTPLAIIDSLEAEFRTRVDSITNALLNYAASGEPVENLARFLQADRNFLGVILALTNLSQEKFLRILSAEHFANRDFANEWNIDTVHNKLQNEVGFAERISRLFLDGRNSPLLVQQVAAFYLDQLALPENWNQIIRDPQLIQNVIRRKLAGEYTDKKGDAVESIIRTRLDAVQSKYGVCHAKGQVRLVGKEIDHAIPSTAEPFIFIMTSYMETTSSSQTQRANEQREMYLVIQNDNLRYGSKRIFINFVDGAGWLARRPDLRKLHESCDYIINLKTLDRLEAIVCKYVPEKYFTVSPRPEVEG